MPLIGFPSRQVRAALSRPVVWRADAVALVLAAGAFGGLLLLASQITAPFEPELAIDLRLSALPKYTILSLGRGFAAYVLSLAFTLVYGSVAAHYPRAERIMIPALDVLQAIPVLGFLPGLVLAMIALFPTRQIGLELACIVMIFTGQVWNMTFSFHASLRGIPSGMREAAAIQGLGAWRTFRLLELPASLIGLIWNSMMSMAGGWFFLTVNEAFTLGQRDFRLPGIGSYTSEAIRRGDWIAMSAAVVAMAIMIVAVDRLLWRPLVVWSQRFKLEDSTDAEVQHSWLLDVLSHSRLLRRLQEALANRHAARASGVANEPSTAARRWFRPHVPPSVRIASRVVVRGIGVLLAVTAIWGFVELLRLMMQLPVFDPERDADWRQVIAALGMSLLRTTSAVALATLWALPVGIWIGRSPRWSRRLQPIIQVVASFPAPMLFPAVTVVLESLGVPFSIGCVALMLLGAQWYVLFNVIAGASAIPADLKEAALSYQLSARQRWLRLYLPAVFPHLVTGLVTATGGAWNATIVSEFVHVGDRTYSAFGIGSLISQATMRGNFPLLAVSVVTMALLVVLLNRLFWRRLYRLAEDRYGLQT